MFEDIFTVGIHEVIVYQVIIYLCNNGSGRITAEEGLYFMELCESLSLS